MAKTSIEWATDVWNPVTGCNKVSQGCKHCYAETIANRFWATQYPPNEDGSPRKFTDVRLHPERLEEPLKWRKPRRVFVNSMSDLFHEDVLSSYIDNVFSVMARCPQHTFMILTKRPHIMRQYFKNIVYSTQFDRTNTNQRWQSSDTWRDIPAVLPNVWLGVSVENQETADERIPILLQTPAAVRFVSYEPALGPVDFGEYLFADPDRPNWARLNRLHWIIMGGESGPGARPMHPDWARSVRDQCQAAGVPFFFKQWGEWAPGGVVDDPGFVGGRAYEVSGHGKSAAIIATPSPGAFQSRGIRPMVPGDETRGGVRMLDIDTVTVRVGKKLAGRLLDGREWNEFPVQS